MRHPRWFVASHALPGEPTLAWFTPAGAEMHVHDWHDASQRAFACRIDTHADPASGAARQLFIAFNPQATAEPFVVPAGLWRVALDSSGDGVALASGRSALVPAHALVVLRSAT